MRILFIISLIVLMFSGTMATAYVQTHNPAMIKELLITVDLFGISQVASDEKKRTLVISKLDIPFEKRDALKKRTIFLGATKEMTVLALDQPKNIYKQNDPQKGSDTDIWVYFFENDTKPTLLYFQDNVLITAEKGSVLNLNYNQ